MEKRLLARILKKLGKARKLLSRQNLTIKVRKCEENRPEFRGKEMSLIRGLGLYYKLPKSDPYAVYLLPNAVYMIQCCFITANFVWAG